MPPLQALVDAGCEVALVVTQPDRRRGRGSDLVPSPVKVAADGLALPVRTPGRAAEVADEVRALDADVGVVVAFGQLLPVPLLDAARLGFVNLHFSLLPRWRGAAPVERAILAGDPETGVCVMRLEEGLDTGPVFASERTPIAPDETAGELRDRLVVLGTDLLVRTLPSVETTMPIPQSGVATHAAKLTVEEFRIDPAAAVADLTRLVRAGNPRPGAWALVEGRRLKVLRAHVQAGDERGPAMATTPGPAPAASSSASLSGPGRVERGGGLVTGDGVLVLDEVQPEGKAAMSGAAWLAGWRSTHGAAQPVFERR
ncbi:MAG: methionyl-tRNA formyltransferase [Acidimicrobiia bacterium]|nr:methionyl-tRNA formyltransferase [Acidimicrobiia bacterium]